MRHLKNLIEAVGAKHYHFDLQSLVLLIQKSVSHQNRFVREIAFGVIGTILISSEGALVTEFAEDFKLLLKHLVPLIPIGLEDHWP